MISPLLEMPAGHHKRRDRSRGEAGGHPRGNVARHPAAEECMAAWIAEEAALRQSQAEAHRLSAQLLEVQESERRRIAADLHDVIGQSLSFIKLGIENTADLLAQGEHQAAGEALHRLSDKVKEALSEVRQVSMNLRPSTLDDLGILATLSWFFREFAAGCRHIRIERTISVDEAAIPPPLKTTIFRILQEAMANIVKHAGANLVRVALHNADGILELTVEDNGKGFDPAPRTGARPPPGLGLRSIEERTRLSGGDYALSSAVGCGTRVSACWRLA